MWYDHASELVAFLIRDNSRRRDIPRGRYLTRRKIDRCLADRIGYQHSLFQLGEFTFGKSRTLGKRNQCACHAVLEFDIDTLGGRCYINCFTPQKVRGFVAAQQAVGGIGRLVFGYLERIGIDRSRRTVRVIADDVDVRMFVEEIDGFVGNPFPVRFVIDIPHVVGLIAVGLKCSRRTVLVVDDVNAHTVAVAEPFIVDARGGYLRNLVIQLYGKRRIASADR